MGSIKRTLKSSTVLVLLLAVGVCNAVIPVIVDTDIGTDYDDAWAIGLLLASPEVDIRLIVTATDNTTARAQIVAKFLERVGRADIPIGIGIYTNNDPVYAYASDYDLNDYPGLIVADGVQAMIDVVQAEPEVTLLELAPTTNLAEAISREPELFAERVRLVAMSGSVYTGYDGSSTPDAEYNVSDNVTAAQTVYELTLDRFPMTTAPLDTCGLVSIDGDNYQRLLTSQSRNNLVFNILEQYRIGEDQRETTSSSTLYDVQAARMTFSNQWLDIQGLPLSVNASGFTNIDYSNGNLVYAATSWSYNGIADWQDDVTDRLLSWH